MGCSFLEIKQQIRKVCTVPLAWSRAWRCLSTLYAWGHQVPQLQTEQAAEVDRVQTDINLSHSTSPVRARSESTTTLHIPDKYYCSIRGARGVLDLGRSVLAFQLPPTASVPLPLSTKFISPTTLGDAPLSSPLPPSKLRLSTSLGTSIPHINVATRLEASYTPIL